MLRRVRLRLVAVSQTCVPHNFVFATDMAFYFPRFQPRTHVASASVLPEIRDAIALLQPLSAPSSSYSPSSVNRISHDTEHGTSRNKDRAGNESNYNADDHNGHCETEQQDVRTQATRDDKAEWRVAGQESLHASHSDTRKANPSDVQAIFPRWSSGLAALYTDSTTSAQFCRTDSQTTEVHSTSDAEAESCRVANRDKALMLIERGLDICESLGGVNAANTTVIHMIRPLYALYFELLAGCEHMPRTEYAMHMHVHKTILHHAGRLLYYDALWDRTSVVQLDTSCVILAHFVRSFCALHTRPFNAMNKPTVRLPTAPPIRRKRNSSAANSTGSSDSNDSNNGCDANGAGGNSTCSSDTVHCVSTVRSSGGTFTQPGESDWWSMPVDPDCPGNIITLTLVQKRLGELSELCTRVYRTEPKRYPEMRWHTPKLQLLQALLTLSHTGNMLVSKQHIDAAAETVYRMKAGNESANSSNNSSPILEGLHGRAHESEFGLFLLAQAEMAARMFDWSAEEVQVGEVDGSVLRAFEHAAAFYATPFNDALDCDGVMNMSLVHSRAFEVQAYAACQLGLAHFLLNAPRPQATSTHDTPIFLARQLFSTSPITTVLTPTPDSIYSNVQSVDKMSLADCRRRIGAALERALQLNRALFPAAACRQNAQAAWILLSMSCMYADVRDYLYAMGLFESASKAMTTCYGARSLEMVLLHKLRYECLAGMGSEQEAATAAHEIVHLLKRIDELPHPIITK